MPLPRPWSREKVFLTVDQVEDLPDAAGDYRVAILFLAYTGVRFVELSVAEVGGEAIFSSPKPTRPAAIRFRGFSSMT